MGKLFYYSLSIVVFISFIAFNFPKAYAAATLTTSPDPICQDNKQYVLTFTGPDGTFIPTENYSLGLWTPGADPNKAGATPSLGLRFKKPDNSTTFTSDPIDIINTAATLGQWSYKLWLGQGTAVLEKNPERLIAAGTFMLYPKESCNLGLPTLEATSPVQVGSTIEAKARNINPDSNYVVWIIDGAKFIDGKFPENSITTEIIKDASENDKIIKSAVFSVQIDSSPGMKILCLKHGKTTLGLGKDNCEISIGILATVTKPSEADQSEIRSGIVGAALKDLFFTTDMKTGDIPLPCAEYKNGKCTSISTAIGNIEIDPQAFVKKIYSVVLGLAGGIALIMIIISGYKFMTSAGNPESLKGATEQLTSAIIGLLFIILAFVILQIVGVDILQIPGFGK